MRPLPVMYSTFMADCDRDRTADGRSVRNRDGEEFECAGRPSGSDEDFPKNDSKKAVKFGKAPEPCAESDFKEEHIVSVLLLILYRE